MKQISSGLTRFYKKTVPVFWFGILATFAISMLLARLEPILLVLPLGGAFFGYLMTRMLFDKLADEVYDCGNYLLIKKGREETRIELSEIVSVDKSWLTNPVRITLRLASGHQVGREIAFAPVDPPKLNPFAENRTLQDLQNRVHAARRDRCQ